MKKLSIDIETYSDVDLTKTGVYRYVESPAFEILLFGVSVDGGPVRVYDLACGECLPDEIVNALVNDTVLKWAYNASFERICISRWIRKAHPAAFRHYAPLGDAVGDYLNPASWRCSRIWGATLGLPLSLKGIGAVLNLDEQKMTEGAALIRYFCMPCKPTKANGMRTRNLPWQSQEKWALFKTYNQRDVEVEQAIQQKLAKFPVPDAIWKEYALDQQINDRGIQIDRTLERAGQDRPRPAAASGEILRQEIPSDGGGGLCRRPGAGNVPVLRRDAHGPLEWSYYSIAESPAQ